MTTSIYFAHHQADYDTDRSMRAIMAVRAALGDDIRIFNPACVVSQRDMSHFCDQVRECDALAFLVCENDTMGPGVAKEVIEAQVHGMPIYGVSIGDGQVTFAPFRFNGVQTIEQAREPIQRSNDVVEESDAAQGSREPEVLSGEPGIILSGEGLNLPDDEVELLDIDDDEMNEAELSVAGYSAATAGRGQ